MFTRIYDCFKMNGLCKIFRLNMNDPRNFDRYNGIDMMLLEQSRQMNWYKYRIHPHSIFRICWETFYCGFIVINVMSGFIMLVLSNLVSHPESLIDPGTVLPFVFLLTDMILVLNIIINLITGIFVRDKTEVIMDLLPIFNSYFKYFMTDTFGLIVGSPVWIHINFTNAKIFKLNVGYVIQACAILCRIASPWYYWRKSVRQYFFPANNLVCSIVGFLLFMPLVMAFAASIVFEVEYNLSSNNFIDKTIGDAIVWYVEMIFRFWSCISVPYDLVHPILFMTDLFLMIFPWIKYFAVTTFLVVFFWSRRVSTNNFNDLTDELHHYLKVVNISDRLRIRLAAYYEEMFDGKYYNEPFILEMVSSELKEELLSIKLSRVREQIYILSMLPAKEFLIVCEHLACEVYFGNDVIVYSGMPHDRMYFIAKGSVAIYSDNANELLHFPNRSHFLGGSILSSSIRVPLNFLACETTILYSLSRVDYLRFRHKCPVFLEYIDFFARLLFEDFTLVLEKESQLSTSL